MIKIPSRDDDISMDIHDDDDHDDDDNDHHENIKSSSSSSSKSMMHWAYMMFAGYKDHPTLPSSMSSSYEQPLMKHDHVVCDMCEVKPIVGIR